jgi:hypothetical protein
MRTFGFGVGVLFCGFVVVVMVILLRWVFVLRWVFRFFVCGFVGFREDHKAKTTTLNYASPP